MKKCEIWEKIFSSIFNKGIEKEKSWLICRLSSEEDSLWKFWVNGVEAIEMTFESCSESHIGLPCDFFTKMNFITNLHTSKGRTEKLIVFSLWGLRYFARFDAVVTSSPEYRVYRVLFVRFDRFSSEIYPQDFNAWKSLKCWMRS